MAEELSRRAAKKAQKQREKERIRVEKAYAKAHPTPITVVTTREEMRLTRKGRYELGSDGKLTANGKSKRLRHRYNVAIVGLIVLIIATYAYFFLVK